MYLKLFQCNTGSENSVRHVNIKRNEKLRIASSRRYVVLVLSANYGNFAPLKFIRARFERNSNKATGFFLFQSDIPQSRVSSRDSEEAIDRSGSRRTRAILAFQREAWANDVCANVR